MKISSSGFLRLCEIFLTSPGARKLFSMLVNACETLQAVPRPLKGNPFSNDSSWSKKMLYLNLISETVFFLINLVYFCTPILRGGPADNAGRWAHNP